MTNTLPPALTNPEPAAAHAGIVTCNSKRFVELDVLRGIAAIGVLACHYSSQCFHLSVIPSRFSLGAYGPHLFFIISGFVIFMTLEKSATALDFVVSRFSRLYPAYWTAVALTFLLLWVLPPDGETVSLRDAVVNLTMLQAWLGVQDLNVCYWTLSVELQFYFMMFLLYVTGLLKRIDLASAVWLGVAALFATTFGHGSCMPVKVIGLLVNARYASLFIAGIAFYKIGTTGPSRYWCAILAACWMEQCFFGDQHPGMVVLGFFAIFFAAMRGWLKVLCWKPLVFLGIVSYPLYLTHEVIGAVLIPRLCSLSQSPLVLIGIPLVLSLALAAAVTFGVERPCLVVIRRLYATWWKREEAAVQCSLPHVAIPSDASTTGASS